MGVTKRSEGLGSPAGFREVLHAIAVCCDRCAVVEVRVDRSDLVWRIRAGIEAGVVCAPEGERRGTCIRDVKGQSGCESHDASDLPARYEEVEWRVPVTALEAGNDVDGSEDKTLTSVKQRVAPVARGVVLVVAALPVRTEAGVLEARGRVLRMPIGVAHLEGKA